MDCAGHRRRCGICDCLGVHESCLGRSALPSGARDHAVSTSAGDHGPAVAPAIPAVAQSPVIYGCFAAMVVLWWAVTAGYYGGSFASWQYLLTGVAAFIMLVGVSVAVARMRMKVEKGVPAFV